MQNNSAQYQSTSSFAHPMLVVTGMTNILLEMCSFRENFAISLDLARILAFIPASKQLINCIRPSLIQLIKAFIPPLSN